jgi:DNA-binding transcriptional MerR regulator
LQTEGVIFLAQSSDELTVRQAAELLNVTTTTIYNLVAEGRLVPSRVEPKVKNVKRFFRRADVEALRSPEQQ